MTRTTRTMSVLSISLAALVFLFSGSAVAQQKYSYEHSTSPQSSRYVQQHRIDIGDVPGHQIRIFEVHNQYTRGHPIIRGTKVVETWARGSSDYINGVGAVRGYGVWVLEDGNEIYTQWTGTTHSDVSSTGSLSGTFNGTTRLTGGTGKFATIRGVVTDVVEFDTDPDSDYNNGSERGEYWFVR
jgi:hypothetical protein